MKTLIFLIITILSQGVYASSGPSLFVWQPTEGAMPLIMCKDTNENPINAAERYLKSFNNNRGLSDLLDSKLDIALEGFSDLSVSSRKPLIATLVNDPAEMSGGKNGKTWYKAFTQAGADVFAIPVAVDTGMNAPLAKKCRQLIAKKFDGLLAIGGSDIDPSLYNENKKHAVNTNLDRDKAVLSILQEYIKAGSGAVFGICRGMQLVAVALGYKLIQDIRRETDNTTNHGWDNHKISLLKVKNSPLRGAFKSIDSITVNSIHHQAVDLESKSNGKLIALAYDIPESSEKYEILEAAMIRGRHGLLIQSHPERMGNSTGRIIIKAMVREAVLARQQNLKKPASCVAILGSNGHAAP